MFPITPRGTPEDKGESVKEFLVEDAAWGERLAVPMDFPCEYVGWWVLRLELDGEKLGETHLWIQFTPY